MDYTIKAPRRVQSYLCQPIYNSNMLLVQCESKKPRKNQVLHFAKYFRREFGYDFIQFGGESENTTDFEAWLFYEQKHSFLEEIPFGAACFRYRNYEGHEPYWAMQWIWLHPYHRGKGIFKKAFPFYKERYGAFEIEFPWAKSMEAFMLKHCPDHEQTLQVKTAHGII